MKRLREELTIAYKLNNTQLYRLIQALIWVGEGRAFSEIARFLQVATATIYNWFWKFAVNGFSWLLKQRYRGRGRKSKLSSKHKQELYDMVVAGPEANGFDCGVWNSAMIAELILLKFNVKYNLRYLSTLLKKLGFSYQKAHFICDRQDEEEYEKTRKQWVEQTWPEILKEAKTKGAVILFGDEVSFAMWGSLGRTWAPRGKQPEVKTTGIRKGLKMFGAMEFKSGDFQYMESLAYSITAKSLKQLKQDHVPVEIIANLKSLKGNKYKTKDAFLIDLQKTIGRDQTVKYQAQALKCAEAAGKFNGETYVKFLEQLLDHFSSPIILIEDGAPYHGSKAVKQFQHDHKERLSVYPLPAFSPDYNPIEKLWKNTKRDATHLKYFKTFEELRESVVKAFNQYLEDATKVICVMKKLRTEAGIAA